ncbi:MAG TPA: DNA mismatch repair endonuclease MutL [Clostridia bacterium]|nr:DNA mismatch repair endonuclease MutL [Clostridia bacterium]
MAIIHKLDRQTINSIAAGEVIERPASVAKELIDNSLDAGASVIRLSLESGGIRKLACEDDGTGMSAEDARLALDSHATSKLITTNDLFSLDTLGFRGEALPSIASVSRLELRTRRREDPEGIRIVVEGGDKVSESPYGMTGGTVVICRDLFFNTPARYKFLKSDAAERGAVADMIGRTALTRPDVSLRLEDEGDSREILYTPGNNDLLSAIFAVFGSETAQHMIPVTGVEAPIKISGYITRPEGSRHNRSRQVFIVNGRVIHSPILRAAADEASKTWFMKGRFPQLVLKLTLAGNLVDINVHPQKSEMRFWDQRAVFRSVYHAIGAALESGGKIISAELTPDVSHLPDQPVDGDERSGTGQKASGRIDPGSTTEQVGLTVNTRAQPPSVMGEQTENYGNAKSGARVTTPIDDPMKCEGDVKSLTDARLIGALFDTYILLEDETSLILVDQHAAHERILYEELLLRHQERSSEALAGQLLLVPIRVSLSETEMNLLEEEEDHFQHLGFDYEPFGSRTVVLRAVPTGKTTRGGYTLDPATALRTALDTMATARSTGQGIDDTEIYHMMACKAAVKAHDTLTADEISVMLERLTSLTNPYHCPHGRPVALRFSRVELEKRFGRLT